jgi:mitochondrial import receptor subunit TOM70
LPAATTLAPGNALCYLNKGLLAFQARQDVGTAMAMAQKALEVDDRCDIAHAHLAQMYLQQENPQAAIACYEKGASVPPPCRTHRERERDARMGPTG